jgi:hypothetical protein
MKLIPERLRVFTGQHLFRGKCEVFLTSMTCTVIDCKEKSHGSVGFSHEGMSINNPRSSLRLWVEKEDGLEECIKLDDAEQYARPGHRLTFIQATSLRNKRWVYSALYNHQTNTFFYNQEGEWRSLFYEGSCRFGCLKLAMLPILSWLVGFLLTFFLVKLWNLNLEEAVAWFVLISMAFGILLLLGYILVGWGLTEVLHDEFRDHLKKVRNSIL